MCNDAQIPTNPKVIFSFKDVWIYPESSHLALVQTLFSFSWNLCYSPLSNNMKCKHTWKRMWWGDLGSIKWYAIKRHVGRCTHTICTKPPRFCLSVLVLRRQFQYGDPNVSSTRNIRGDPPKTMSNFTTDLEWVDWEIWEARVRLTLFLSVEWPSLWPSYKWNRFCRGNGFVCPQGNCT